MYKIITSFKDGFAVVRTDDYKFNAINIKGELVSKEWYNKIEYFAEGFLLVYKNRKQNLINKDGKLVFADFYDDIQYKKKGCCSLTINDKQILAHLNGTIFPNQKFYHIYEFNRWYAMVERDDKNTYSEYNIIDTEGNLLFVNWWHSISRLHNNFISVRYDSLSYIYDLDKKRFVGEGYHSIYYANEGFFLVRKQLFTNLYNFISTDDELISKDWFDQAECFSEGYALVTRNDETFFIDTKGNKMQTQEHEETQLNNIYMTDNPSADYIEKTLTEKQLKELTPKDVLDLCEKHEHNICCAYNTLINIVQDYINNGKLNKQHFNIKTL